MFYSFGRAVLSGSRVNRTRGSLLKLAAAGALLSNTLTHASDASPVDQQPLSVEAAVERALELTPEVRFRPKRKIR